MKLVAFFIRHGETDFNEPPNGEMEKFRGDLDVPLNKDGEAQAAEIPNYLAGYRLSALYHSGMHRTAQTVEPLAKAKGLESTKIENMNGLDTGDFSGLPKTEENKNKLSWYREHPDEVIPGGESVQHFRDRVDPIIHNVVKVGEEADAPTAAAIHGSVMREVSRLFDKSYDSLKVEPGGIVGIFKDTNGNYLARPLIREAENDEDMDRPGS
jgi:2,3-bisphosphoglycerate-dependent phosphoglycerate mutase